LTIDSQFECQFIEKALIHKKSKIRNPKFKMETLPFQRLSFVGWVERFLVDGYRFHFES